MSDPDDERTTFITHTKPEGFPGWLQIARFGGTATPLYRWECGHHAHRWTRRSAWYDEQVEAIARARAHIGKTHHDKGTP